MKRPARIYELLGMISDGTFLNSREFNELEQYIDSLEERIRHNELHERINHSDNE